VLIGTKRRIIDASFAPKVMVRENRGWLWQRQTYAAAIIALAVCLLVTGPVSQTKEAFAGGGGGKSGVTEQCNEKTCVVRMTGLTFTPDTLKVRPGATVLWTNSDKIPHTVTSGLARDKDPLFDSGFASPITAGGEWQWTFAADSPGVFHYYCGFHPGMIGQIIVTGEPIEEFPRLVVMALAGAGVLGTFGLVAAIHLRKK